jgi:hypothetical protein
LHTAVILYRATIKIDTIHISYVRNKCFTLHFLSDVFTIIIGCLPGCGDMQPRVSLLTSQRCLLPPSSG